MQVASIDTSRHREPPPADLVIVDEAHRSLARTYLDAILHYTGADIVEFDNAGSRDSGNTTGTGKSAPAAPSCSA